MNKPYFSIVVITYNSSKYVEETLESIKNQTYKNFELIITDDCSQDHTVQLCQDWLKKYSNAFKRVQLKTINKNTGIPANCNRGINASKGDWIKIIAGDDILSSNAITDYANYIHSSKFSHQPLNVVFSRIASFERDVTEAKEVYNNNITNYILFHPNISQSDQIKLYCRGQLITIITMVFSRKMFDDVNGFDEQYKLREDRPFIYKILCKGYKLYFMDKLTFFYRQHSESIMRLKKSRTKALEIKIDNVWAPQLKYRYPNLTWFEKSLAKISYKKDRIRLNSYSNEKRFKINLSIIKIFSYIANYLDKFIKVAILSTYKIRYKDACLYDRIKNN